MAKKKPSEKPADPIVKHPAVAEEWRENLQRSSFRTGFHLNLTQPMLEFLCAVADDVHWDRTKFPNLHVPDNWFATEHALKKRGLIVRKSDEERRKAFDDKEIDGVFRAMCELTPAGKLVVSLLREAGMFVAADDSFVLKSGG